MYDDTWGEVVLMSGLPGTGKDTWIRKELGILPSDNQSKVVDAATQRAKALLRKKQAFVWNATNITPQTRGRQVELFTDYGASVKIVYLETDTREQIQRNENWPDAVPTQVISRVIEKLASPEAWEAHWVEWRCV